MKAAGSIPARRLTVVLLSMALISGCSMGLFPVISFGERSIVKIASSDSIGPGCLIVRQVVLVWHPKSIN